MARPSSSRKGATSRTNPPARKQRLRAASLESLTEDLLTQEEVEGREFEVCEKRVSRTVPKSLVKLVIGLFLLPVAWILTKTFLQAFTTSLHHGLLATQPFGCFASGAVLFGILFFIVPQQLLMIPYVLGHEVTHALWVWLFGGKVADHFHVSEEGGHVMTDRVNTWIILSPYFFPIYSVLVVTLYGAASLAADLNPFRWILFLLLGFTLAFHLVFTCLLIMKGQPDLHYGGTFFSLMVIYLINLMVITGLLLCTSRIITLQHFGTLLAANTIDLFETSRALLEWALDEFGELWSSFISK